MTVGANQTKQYNKPELKKNKTNKRRREKIREREREREQLINGGY